MPKGNDEINITNRSRDSKLYFSHLGKKTKADFSSVGYPYTGAVLQGGTVATPGANWSSTGDKDNRTISISLIWVILVPLVLVLTIIGLVIALIRKNKAE